MMDKRTELLEDVLSLAQRCAFKASELKLSDPDGFYAPILSGALIKSTKQWLTRIDAELEDCLLILKEEQAMSLADKDPCQDVFDQTTKSVLPAQTGI